MAEGPSNYLSCCCLLPKAKEPSNYSSCFCLLPKTEELLELLLLLDFSFDLCLIKFHHRAYPNSFYISLYLSIHLAVFLSVNLSIDLFRSLNINVVGLKSIHQTLALFCTQLTSVSTQNRWEQVLLGSHSSILDLLPLWLFLKVRSHYCFFRVHLRWAASTQR